MASALTLNLSPRTRHFRGAKFSQLASACWYTFLGTHAVTALAAEPVRVATFNVSLYGQVQGEILERLKHGDDSQARHVAEIIQRVRPDVLLLNEIDYDPQGEVLRTFCEKYLAVGQHASESSAGPAEPIEFPYNYIAPSNTGRHSGFDLDRSGAMNTSHGNDAYAADAWGYGRYEGQYALAILSKFPIEEAAIRTFQNFRWKDMPGSRLPDDPSTPAPGDWYGADALEKFPLSSKNHCDVPITIDGRRVHLLVSHPTPPVFDGPEDRNGRRNHDELRFWGDYVGGLGAGGSGLGEDCKTSSYIYDDKGLRGGLGANQTPSVAAVAERSSPQPSAPSLQSPSFILLGDLNGDPHDGDGSEGIAALLAVPRVLTYPPPESLGAAEQARLQGAPNDRHRGDPRQDTIDAFDGRGPGNLRIDHVLPSADLQVASSGVFWPDSNDPLFKLVGVEPFPSSDHRLVWVDLVLTDQPGRGAVLPTDR